jgi:hypothetical protein
MNNKGRVGKRAQDIEQGGWANYGAFLDHFGAVK